MPKFSVYGKVWATKYLGEFEAETKEEAIAMALDSDESSVSVCHQCAREVEDPHIEECEADEVRP